MWVTDWAGRLYGTNTGNLFTVLNRAEEGSLAGDLHVMDDRLGPAVFSMLGVHEGRSIKLTGTVRSAPEGVELGDIVVEGVFDDRGSITGRWRSRYGAAGRFVLYPHGQPGDTQDQPRQLFTPRHDFGPIDIDQPGIVELAKEVQKDFQTPVVVSLNGTAAGARFLEDFEAENLDDKTASIVKIRGAAPEVNGISRTVLIEFGPSFNYVTTESTDEAWARGKKDKLQDCISKYERKLSVYLKGFGVGFHHLLLGAMLVALPSFSLLWQRVSLVVVTFGVIFGLQIWERRVLKFANIRLGRKQPRRALNNFLSWLGVAVAGTIEAVAIWGIGRWLGG